MTECFYGVVIKTVPHIKIKFLTTGRVIRVRPGPNCQWLSFGREVVVSYDHTRNRIGQIRPKFEEEEKPLSHQPITMEE